MPTPAPETAGVEAAIHLCSGPALRDFGGGLVGVFGLVVVPLLLVGEVFDDDEGDEGAGEEDVDVG